MLTFLAFWLCVGAGLEIAHQVEEPSSRVVGIVGRVTAWPAVVVEKTEKPEPIKPAEMPYAADIVTPEYIED